MPRTRNVTRAQWEAAVSPTADPGASALRTTSIQHRRVAGQPLGYVSTSTGSSLKNRTYNRKNDDENDEIVDENMPPVVDVKGKGKGKAKERPQNTRKRKQQPLQDITDLVVSHGNRASDVEDTPRGSRRVERTRRNPSHLPRLTPITQRTPNTRKRFPSSLPPSSPPPPASLDQHQSDAQPPSEILEEVVPEEAEELPIASDGPESARNSDPFGFFAVERELKAERDHNYRPYPATELRERGGLVLVPATSPSPLQWNFPAARAAAQEEDVFVSPCATPRTPHKKRKWASNLSTVKGKGTLGSPLAGSLPSSPSPYKIREPPFRDNVASRRSDFVKHMAEFSDSRRKKSDKDQVEENEIVIETPNLRVLRSRLREKNIESSIPLRDSATRVKLNRDSTSRTPSDPVECAQRLVNRLPKRRRKKNEATDEERPVENRPRRSPQKRPARARKTVKNTKPSGTLVEKDKDREAIRDYFKQLEGYSLETENVESSHGLSTSSYPGVNRQFPFPGAHPPPSTALMNPSQPGPRVQRGFEPEKSGFILPREQSPYLAALLRYITAVNAMNFDTITEVFDASLKHIIWPSTLKKPRLSYDQYLKYFDSLTEMFAEFQVQIFDIIEERDKMSVQLLATGKGRSGQAYFNETVLLIRFQQSSSRDERKYGPNAATWPPDALPKMVEVTEYVDSESTKAFFTAETAWLKNNKDVVAQQQQAERSQGRGWIKTRWKQKQSTMHSPTITQGVVPGQPTQFNISPTMGPGYQHAYPPMFAPGGFSLPRSQGQGQGQGSPATPSSRSYTTSTPFGSSSQGQSYSYSRSGQGYYPPSKDK